MSSKTPKNYLASLYNSTTNFSHNNNHHFEFNEEDIWTNSSSAFEPKNPIPTSRAPRKSWALNNRPSAASSLPVNIPDWSKIMGKEERRKNEDDNDDEDDDNEDGLEECLPPHEYVAKKLARTRIVPFSMHEGIGRTLKGRDLSRVRNAVWKQTGFED